MDNTILDDKLQTYRFKINEIVKQLHLITIEIGNQELSSTVNDLRDRINDPFMFVICGEVKAGKSSFINALLNAGKEVCKVAPDPCTDSIQQIMFGTEENTVVINDYLKKILLPVPILKDIAIVDTPGTNTISDHHQEVTERFVPGSDLIIFVFEAKNPYRQSAWEFFDFIHSDWRKKVIFVLQQADLMNPEDLVINIEGVRKYAVKKGIEQPKIFAVSAKFELENKKEESGFLPVRQFIQENITGGQAPYLKLINNLDTFKGVSNRIQQGLDVRIAQFNEDVNFRKEVTETLNDQHQRSNNQVNLLVENLLGGYDRVTRTYGTKLSEGLGFFSIAKRTISGLFKRKKSKTEDWFVDLTKSLETDLTNELRPKLDSGVHDIAESIQQMAKLIDLKIKNSKTILKENHEIFGDIADKRSNVLRDLQREFEDFLNKDENFLGTQMFENSSISPNVVTGSGIALIGMVVATVAQGAVFDITGGLIAAVGMVFAGITASVKRKQIVESYNTEIKKGRDDIEKEIVDKLTTYIENIKQKIDDNFDEFDAMIALEEQQIEKFQSSFASVQTNMDEVEHELSDFKSTL